MNVAPPATNRNRRRRGVLVAVLAFVLVLVGVALVAQHAIRASGSPSSASSPASIGSDGVVNAADGIIPDGATVSVFDDESPAVANLDPALLSAIRQAATNAAEEDIVFEVNSGWRSPDYQRKLLDEAVVTYGSKEEAARWVSTPETSQHVTGDAIDLGPFDATYWLSLNGADYGLCQIYSNESWHYELRPDAVTDGCPEQYLDPTEDPRMRG